MTARLESLLIQNEAKILEIGFSAPWASNLRSMCFYGPYPAADHSNKLTDAPIVISDDIEVRKVQANELNIPPPLLTSSWTLTLPAHLHTILVDRISIDPEAFATLPAGLRRMNFFVSSSRFRLAHLTLLPPKIKDIAIQIEHPIFPFKVSVEELCRYVPRQLNSLSINPFQAASPPIFADEDFSSIVSIKKAFAPFLEARPLLVNFLLSVTIDRNGKSVNCNPALVSILHP